MGVPTSFSKRLTDEICQFEKFIAPLPQEHQNRDKLKKIITDLIHEVDPTCSVNAYGSHITGLALPSSDLDLTIVTSQVSTLGLLKRIRKLAIKNRLCSFDDTMLIPGAKVKILALHLRSLQLDVDISVNTEHPSTDQTVEWIQRYPPLKPLYLVLKHALLCTQLPNQTGFQAMSSKVGGLAGFSLVCLIVHFLQHQAVDMVEPDVGQLLLAFLDFYSKFEFDRKCLDMDPEHEPYRAKTKEDRHPIVIVDPKHPGTNVCRSVSNKKKLQRCFRYVYDCLIRAGTSANTRSPILSTVILASDPFTSELTPKTKRQHQGCSYKILPLNVPPQHDQEESSEPPMLGKRKRSENPHRPTKKRSAPTGNLSRNTHVRWDD
ncbi:Nucleotidyltransferase [Hesseltinella vesiculosa]|uniref:Nucleotidyltransferase n=1 Tax=Hesseltinella vesiculosa TaxID=101127 RepID=A0A1X2GW09_9FUNG|nr:Nucleotidyltransferase [Hesseltinella vesiculosa]